MKYLTVILLLISFQSPADSVIIGGLSYHFDRNAGYNEKHACFGYSRANISIMGCDNNSYKNKSIYLLYKPHKHVMLGVASGYTDTDKDIPMIGSLALFAGLVFEFDFGRIKTPVIVTNSGLISWIDIAQ